MLSGGPRIRCKITGYNWIVRLKIGGEEIKDQIEIDIVFGRSKMVIEVEVERGQLANTEPCNLKIFIFMGPVF